jgi:hypothetical protein
MASSLVRRVACVTSLDDELVVPNASGAEAHWKSWGPAPLLSRGLVPLG